MQLIMKHLHRSRSAHSQRRLWLVGGLLFAFLVATSASVGHIHTSFDGDGGHSVAYNDGAVVDSALGDSTLAHEHTGAQAIAELLSGGHYCELCLYLDLLDHGQPVDAHKPPAVVAVQTVFSHYDFANASSLLLSYHSRAPPLAV